MNERIINLTVTDEQFQTILDALWQARLVYQKYDEPEDEARCVSLWNELYGEVKNENQNK